jgi:uncharacterized protein (DUF362 family)
MAGLTAAGLVGAAAYRTYKTKGVRQASVFVARNQTYVGDLTRTISDGFAATGLEARNLKGKTVLLKPNMVEPRKDSPHMTTEPRMILAAAEYFRKLDAKVIVGEGPGHIRDTEAALIDSGVGEALEAGDLDFRDLNYEATQFVVNRGKVAPKLRGFYFPQSVMEADLIVSMPKMKTHHWVGVTAGLKNMYGVIPGIRYGWPKNVLHHNGIPNTVFDINASLPKTVVIVDAIDCMEGDGPIMGSLKHMGLVIVGTVPTAVDATCCRIMDVDPAQIEYLQFAAIGGLGPIGDAAIYQRGEAWQPLQSPFKVLDREGLRKYVKHRGVQVT